MYLDSAESNELASRINRAKPFKKARFWGILFEEEAA